MKQEQLQTLQPVLFERFVRILQNERLAHAYLFSGSFASFDMALFLSQAIFCQEAENHLPCGQCRNCRLVAQQEFPDLTIIAPQGNVIKTDTVRELVKDFSQSGFESNKQVFIIRDADKMHANAANSLLKAIEEPESDIHIFLLTNQEEAVLSTIKSRTQLVSFPKNLPYLENFLEEKGLLKNQARLIAQLVGSLEEAEEVAENKSFLDALSASRKMIDSLFTSKEKAYLQVSSLAAVAGEKAEQGRIFDVLTILLAEKLENKMGQVYLENLLQARRMWLNNVSFQNALEYWVLTTGKK